MAKALYLCRLAPIFTHTVYYHSVMMMMMMIAKPASRVTYLRLSGVHWSCAWDECGCGVCWLQMLYCHL